jgi:alpha-galactosidase
LGVQGFKYSAADGVEIWFRPLAGGDWAMAVLNPNEAPRQVTFDWTSENVVDELSGRKAGFGAATYRLRDLWAKEDVGTTAAPLTADVPGHDVLMLRLAAH